MWIVVLFAALFAFDAAVARRARGTLERWAASQGMPLHGVRHRRYWERGNPGQRGDKVFEIRSVDREGRTRVGDAIVGTAWDLGGGEVRVIWRGQG